MIIIIIITIIVIFSSIFSEAKVALFINMPLQA